MTLTDDQRAKLRQAQSHLIETHRALDAISILIRNVLQADGHQQDNDPPKD